MNHINDPIHILGIAGSLRARSLNRALLYTAADLLPAGATLTIADLAGIPLYNSDLEAAGTPAAVLAFREQIKAADALLIATPEYNYSIPGVLKNALDWASRRGPDEHAPLDGKAAAIFGAGGRGGTVRAQMHLRDILLHNQLDVVSAPQIMIMSAYREFDEDLTLTNPRYRDGISRLLDALVHQVRRQRAYDQILLTV